MTKRPATDDSMDLPGSSDPKEGAPAAAPDPPLSTPQRRTTRGKMAADLPAATGDSPGTAPISMDGIPEPFWTDLEVGLLLGLLIGEGHFGGDGKQPQVTLRMHTDHEALFAWLTRTFPGGKLYGPYNHGGRRYLQWMVRGAYLRETLLPLLEQHLDPALDAKTWQRYQEMKRRYHL